MENKYYTPTIEEFHIGFEYEHLSSNFPDINNKFFKPCIYDYSMASLLWERMIVNKEGNLIKELVPAILKVIESKQCRVKFLDKSDIESLGWEEFTYKTIDGFIMFEKLLTINYNYKEPVVDISYLPTFKNQGLSRIFRGTIKNKSELIKLMQQLNIK
jgi:hypothetical protein